MKHPKISVSVALLLCLIRVLPGWAWIETGGSGPVKNAGWPAGAEALANLPSRHSFWVGPPFGGGNYHFNYAARNTADFQAALDAFAAIEAPRLELIVYDGVTNAPSALADGKVHWEFEIWDRAAFERLSQPRISGAVRDNPWFGKPVPAPVLTLYLGPDNPINWSAVRVPANVTVLDRRVATSPYASSTGGVVRTTIRNMASGKPLAGAVLEVGHYTNRVFQGDVAVTAGADGVAVARDLLAGNHVLRVRCEGFATRQIGYFQNFGHTLGIFDDVKLAPAAVLHGRVIDAERKPLAGVSVGISELTGSDQTSYEQNLYNEHTKVQTDADGRFTIEGLPTGQVCLRAQKPGYYYSSRAIHDVPEDPVRIVMTLSGVIRGRVTGTDRLATNEVVRVSLDPLGEPKVGRWGGDKPCDADGAFVFEGVPADTYTLTAVVVRPERGGYSRDSAAPAQPSREVTLKTGEKLEIDLELK